VTARLPNPGPMTRGKLQRNWQLSLEDLPDKPVIRRYIHDCDRRGLRAETLRAFRGHLIMLGRWTYPDSILTATKEQLEEFMDSRRVTHVTRYRLISGFHGFYDWACGEELLAIDPTLRIRRPKMRRTIPRPIDSEDLEVAVAHADTRMKCWLLLAALQGLRAGEIAALCRMDVLDSHDPPLLLVSEKGAKGGNERMLPLHPDTLAALRAYGLSVTDSGPMFRRMDGGPLQSHSVSYTVSEYFERLGIPATLHMLRHWFGTSLYAASHDLRLVQEAMGHQNPNTTAGYAAWNAVDLGPAVRGLSTRRPRLYDTKGES
jgi:integrase